MKLIMPMAGRGARFGPKAVKPLVDVDGVPLFVYAERSIGLDFDERIFIVQAEHQLNDVILGYYPEAKIVELDHVMDGTVCSVLEAREHWQDGSSIFIANCDQYVEWDTTMLDPSHDASIATFKLQEGDPKWSYVEMINEPYVERVVAKEAISTDAVVGWYYWKDGRDYERCAEAMIAADDRVKGEFYVCPVYNYFDKQVTAFQVQRMVGLGTLEDYQAYLLDIQR